MKRPQNMKNLVGILKDKVSLLKATLLISSKPTASFHVAVLRATTHRHPSDPPPLDAVLTLANHYRPSTSGVLVHALLQRLHGTGNVYVALKCLLTLHHVITNGSPALKEQILCYSNGPLLNLSGFKDDSRRDTWELSEWVRWYADVIDHGVVLSRRKNRGGERLGLLVGMVEVICGAPETLHYQRISLIYEVIKLVVEDYRIIMREINTLINQFAKQRIQDLSNDSIGELLNDLKRLENCREKLVLMFLNKKNDGVWELIGEVRKDVEEVKHGRENMSLVSFQRNESTRVAENRVTESRTVVVVPTRRSKRWLDVEWNTMVASYG